MPPQVQHINGAGPQYSGPVMRSASPATTVSDPPDETSYDDANMSADDFKRMVEEEMIKLRSPRPEELLADKEPLLLPRPKTREEERARFVEVMANLRTEVKKIEENELFEQSVRRDSMIGLEPQPSTNDIEKIMRSLMSPAVSAVHMGSTNASTVTPGMVGSPWTPSIAQLQQLPSTTAEGTDSSTTTVGKRPIKGKARLRPKAT